MATWWATRGRARRDTPEEDITEIIDLIDDLADDQVVVAAEAPFQRARAAREAAQEDLIRLRARHWSGERLIEEGRAPFEWWEHPDADPYAVLGLLPGAPITAAAAARRRVARSCHPDRVGVEGAEREQALRRMVAANAAYDRLRRALHPV